MKNVIMCVEPSKRLSEMVGFPYFIERKFPLDELLAKGVVTQADAEEMERGTQICKPAKVV